MSARTLQHFVNNILIELGWKKVVQGGKRQIKICWTNKFVCMSNLRMLHTRTHTYTHWQTQFMRHQHKLFLSTSSSGSAVHLVVSRLVSCGQPCNRKVFDHSVLEDETGTVNWTLKLEVEIVYGCVCVLQSTHCRWSDTFIWNGEEPWTVAGPRRS